MPQFRRRNESTPVFIKVTESFDKVLGGVRTPSTTNRLKRQEIYSLFRYVEAMIFEVMPYV